MADEYDWHYPGSGAPPVTAPEKLTVEQVGQDRRTVKALWVAHGGEQHGPIVEHYSIEEQAFYRFVDALLAHHRQQAEARAEATLADAVARIDFLTKREAGLVETLEGIANMTQPRLSKEEASFEMRDAAIAALTAYRSASTPPDDSVARIVAWLRKQCSDPMLPDFAEFLSAFADAIERGDWR